MGVKESVYWSTIHYKIDRDILQLPEMIIETYDTKPQEILRPMFDKIWNACGFARSLNFDESGNWTRDR